MDKICNEIRTCLSGAAYMLEHSKLGEVEALYKSIYRVARRYGSPADARHAAKALVVFCIKSGRLSSKCRVILTSVYKLQTAASVQLSR
jgi:hypothetical protein